MANHRNSASPAPEKAGDHRSLAGATIQTPRKIVDIHFHIESGYVWGHGMSHEQYDAFYAEIRSLCSDGGFSCEDIPGGDCFYAIKDKTRLYVHPQSLSGPCLEHHIPQIESLLASGRTFKHERTDIHGELYDFTPQQEIEYYHQTHDHTIHTRLMNLFKTKRRDYFRERALLEEFAQSIHIDTTVHTGGCGTYSPAFQYLFEVYNDLKNDGFIIETTKKLGICNIPYCRAANQTEIRQIGKQYLKHI